MYAGSATKPVTAQMRFRGGVDVRVMTGNEVFNARSANYQSLDPGGSDRTITLPLANNANGLVFCIAHSGGANLITVQTPAPATVATLNPGAGVTVGSNGTSWAVVGPQSQTQPTIIADPGDAGAIPVTSSGTVAITTAGAETRTLAAPSFAGQLLSLTLDVDGGDCVITVASAIDEEGSTTITLNDAGDYIALEGVTVGGVLVWRVRETRGPLLNLAGVIADPGDAGAIPVNRSGFVALVSAGVETRILADPTFVGQRLTLFFDTDGGDITVTAANNVSQAASTTLVTADAGDHLALEAITVGGALRWRVLANDGWALS